VNKIDNLWNNKILRDKRRVQIFRIFWGRVVLILIRQIVIYRKREVNHFI
jgi:hypothetical protein